MRTRIIFPLLLISVAPAQEVAVLPAPHEATSVYTTAVSTDSGATWTARGLGGQITAIAADRADAAVLYASTAERIYKSSNGGVDWTPLAGSPSSANSIAVHPSNSQIIHAGIDGSVTRSPAFYQVYGLSSSFSSDGGATWSSTGASSGNFAQRAVTLLPGTPATRYWIHRSIDSCFWTIYGGYCRYSNSLCQERSTLACSTETNIAAYAAAPADPCVVYAGTDAGEVLRSSTCGSVTLASLNAGFSTSVSALAVSPADSSMILAGLSDGRVFRKSGAGPWTPVASLDGSIVALLFEPDSPTVVYAGTAYWSFDKPGRSIHKSTDGGATFSRTSFANGVVTAMAISPALRTTIHVGSACSYRLEPSPLQLTASAGSASANIETPSGCPWNISIGGTWLTLTSPASGTGPSTVTFTYTANPLYVTRHAPIYLYSETYTAQQAGQPCAVSLGAPSDSVGTGSTSRFVSVTAPGGCPWTAVSNASWITLNYGTSGSGDGTVGYSVAANFGTARTGTITIGGQTFTVNQGGTPCPFTLNPASALPPAAGGAASMTVTTAAGCAWSANSNAAWITITSGTSGIGSGTVNYSVAPNGASTQRTSSITVAGRSFSITQLAAGVVVSPIPSTGVPNPSSGTGSSRSFTFSFTDANGASDLFVLNILINSAIEGRNSCYLAYLPSGASAGTLVLVNDAGDAGGPFAGTLALPGSGTISNSQCSVNGAGSSASTAGNTLTLTLNMTFAAGYAGNHAVYAAARDLGGNNSGWHAKGVWNIPGGAAQPTRVTSLSPSRASSNTVTLTAQFADDTGFADFSVLNLLINDAIDGRNACYVAFVQSIATLVLVNNAGDAGGPFAGSVPIPGAGTASNSQCTVNASLSSASGSGGTLTLTLHITFAAPFAGDRIVYAAARDNSGNNSGWQALGTISIP
jgi:hypothetical protein